MATLNELNKCISKFGLIELSTFSYPRINLFCFPDFDKWIVRYEAGNVLVCTKCEIIFNHIYLTDFVYCNDLDFLPEYISDLRKQIDFARQKIKTHKIANKIKELEKDFK